MRSFLPMPAWCLVGACLLGASCGSSGGDAPPTHGGSANTSTRWRDYIRASPYPKLVLELDAVAGKGPMSQSSTEVVSELGGILGKPGGISIALHETVASRGADHAWTFQELQDLASSTFNLQVPGDTTKMHLLFLDGHSADDTSNGRVLGLAWSHTHLVMFTDTIHDVCEARATLLVGRDRLCAETETGVWIHEIGHLLGLVDNGLPMVANHRDPDAAHGRHDANDACVMYWAYEGEAAVDRVLSNLIGGGGGAPSFDAQCLADIAAIRDAP